MGITLELKSLLSDYNGNTINTINNKELNRFDKEELLGNCASIVNRIFDLENGAEVDRSLVYYVRERESGISYNLTKSEYELLDMFESYWVSIYIGDNEDYKEGTIDDLLYVYTSNNIPSSYLDSCSSIANECIYQIESTLENMNITTDEVLNSPIYDEIITSIYENANDNRTELAFTDSSFIDSARIEEMEEILRHICKGLMLSSVSPHFIYTTRLNLENSNYSCEDYLEVIMMCNTLKENFDDEELVNLDIEVKDGKAILYTQEVSYEENFGEEEEMFEPTILATITL